MLNRDDGINQAPAKDACDSNSESLINLQAALSEAQAELKASIENRDTLSRVNAVLETELQSCRATSIDRKNNLRLCQDELKQYKSDTEILQNEAHEKTERCNELFGELIRLEAKLELLKELFYRTSKSKPKTV